MPSLFSKEQGSYVTTFYKWRKAWHTLGEVVQVT
jgi:hypothetical protein